MKLGSVVTSRPLVGSPYELIFISVYFDWKLSFRRGSTTALSRGGAQVYKSCKLDGYGEPVDVSLEELARLRSLVDAVVPNELQTPERVSDELLASPVSKRFRLAGDNAA